MLHNHYANRPCTFIETIGLAKNTYRQTPKRTKIDLKQPCIRFNLQVHSKEEASNQSFELVAKRTKLEQTKYNHKAKEAASYPKLLPQNLLLHTRNVSQEPSKTFKSAISRQCVRFCIFFTIFLRKHSQPIDKELRFLSPIQSIDLLNRFTKVTHSLCSCPALRNGLGPTFSTIKCSEYLLHIVKCLETIQTFRIHRTNKKCT